ncbi:helicase-related protein [Novosphingobium sp. ZN18A2]|uniref:helicase-related protein n=1 Tax=Novosphingobium sp. ZN18A2 TaxID=3079861 RepID=UPI0030D2866C
MLSPARVPAKGRDSAVKAVLGPTNTGKTHLAIERMIAHSSGAIGFPLRLLAREVYDRVCAIKGEHQVALITGEERIEPPGARWMLCTAEAMPRNPDLAFIALDEAQLSADPERGHIFTDRLLHTRGREETMLLGSSVIEPVVKALVPGVEVISRPRFSTLSHVEPKKLSRVPPRSAIVAFSAEQVYAIAEMLRRFRGGSAVVMGALSPETRNKQVAMYQAGEVDYLVATDAIGMGLNLDIGHVAFAGLSKFDGKRQRRLTVTEMAQIAGRAGRHQRDGTFSTLAGMGGRTAEFAPEEVFAIEEHRFPPLTKLFWRESDLDFTSIDTLLSGLESPPPEPELAPAPEAIDLAVLRRLSEDPAIAGTVRGERLVERFWAVCSLPDFRQHGAETHSRFVARLWQDLRGGYLGADYVAQAIAQLDNPSGDIDTLQGRISAIRSWAYIAQRPDWVLAKEEMAARARAVEARLSDALHARLTERFVNRRTALLMKKLGPDAGLLPVSLSDTNDVMVDDETIGRLEGFRFVVDPRARHGDHKLLLAAAEKHLSGLLAKRAGALVAAANGDEAEIELEAGEIRWNGAPVARLEAGRDLLDPRLRLDPSLDRLDGASVDHVTMALESWLARRFARPLHALRKLDAASRDADAGPEIRALLLHLVERGGVLARADSGIERLDKRQRHLLRRLGVTVGALDIFAPATLKPAAIAAWHTLATIGGARIPHPSSAMPAVLPAANAGPGYRRCGKQAIRVDLAERLLREAHDARAGNDGSGDGSGARRFRLKPALARSMGLAGASHAALLRDAGFRVIMPRRLDDSEHGAPAPPLWHWRPARPRRPARSHHPRARGTVSPGNPFAELLELVR